jgi:iron(III) transport system ATP-binding protein
MAHLQVRDLCKRFGDTQVLSGASFQVQPGELVAVLGASGSGKTTLLRLICGFERADAGSIEIDGRVVADARTHIPPEQRLVGYVAQEGALFPHLSVADNIVFGLPRWQRRKRYRVVELLELVGLPASFADRQPQALSGGEQQRVALARALAPSPKLILLDEPFSALDAALRLETRAAVAAALATAGATAMLVTHDQAEALSMGHEVAVLQHGRLVQVADPVTLYRRPATAELASFVGEAVLLPGVAADGCVICALGRFRLAAEMPAGPVEVLVRPEQILLSSRAAGVPARVTGVTFYGHDASIRLDVRDRDEHRIVIARVAGYAAPQSGTEVSLAVAGEVTAFARGERSRAIPANSCAPHNIATVLTSVKTGERDDPVIAGHPRPFAQHR